MLSTKYKIPRELKEYMGVRLSKSSSFDFSPDQLKKAIEMGTTKINIKSPEKYVDLNAAKAKAVKQYTDIINSNDRFVLKGNELIGIKNE